MVSDLDRVCGGRFAARHVVATQAKPHTISKGRLGAETFPGGAPLGSAQESFSVVGDMSDSKLGTCHHPLYWRISSDI